MDERLPWLEGESILDLIRRWDRSHDDELVLPDEPPFDPAGIRWSAGSLEGTMIRHGLTLDDGASGPTGFGARVLRRIGVRRPPAEIVSRLKRLVRHPADPERLALYRVLQNHDALTNVDDVLERLVSDRALLGATAPHARWLVSEARHRGPLKFGIALLGVSGEPEDAEVVKVVARHDEFTLYCAVALGHLLGDPTDALWEVAKGVDGWGKVEAVARLAPRVGGRADIKRWLLTDGCENAVANDYLAYACATAGGLADALAGPVDDALLDGACTIVSALCTGGAAEQLDDYADAPVVVARLLDLLQDRCQSVKRLATVFEVAEWIGDTAPEDLPGWSDQLTTDLIERSASILRQPHWPARLQEAFEHGDGYERWIAWSVGPLIGLDLWELGFARLSREPLDDTLVGWLMEAGDRARRERIVEWAEQHLAAERIATGPAEILFPYPELFSPEDRAIEAAVNYIVQKMGDGECYSERLVAAALLAPIVNTRNHALEAIAAQPREKWGASVEAALERLTREDPDDEVRADAVRLLARG